MEQAKNPPRYTAAVGLKFDPEGKPQRYAGNTIISRVPAGSALQATLSAAQRRLMELTSCHHWVFLPPESFHMTVMELLCDQERRDEKWSRYLSLSAALPECDRFMHERLSAVAPPGEMRMRAVGLYAQEVIVLVLQPADEKMVQRLFDYREQVAEATGVRFPDHDGYVFHITLGYKLVELDREAEMALGELAANLGGELADELATITMPPPRLAFFENLFAFHDQREE